MNFRTRNHHGSELSRRQFIAGATGAALVGCTDNSGAGTRGFPAAAPTGTSSSSAIQSLDDLARESSRRFGSVISWSPNSANAGAIQNPAYAALVSSECSTVVAENDMKWQRLRPSRNEFDFARMDDIAAWAQATGQSLRGHTLLWHRPRWFPEWLNNHDFGANPVREAEQLLTEHITTVMARYPAISSYDVVNEAIDHDRNAPMETSLSRAMGTPESVIDLAFHVARDAGPNKELVYNDYMSWEPAHAGHRRDVLRLLEGFRRRNTPVDTLGIQSHIEMYSIDPATGLGPYQEAAWREFLNAVTDMGYRLMITELDVKDKALTSDIERRDAAVAEYLKRYMNVMLEYPQLRDILVWGMVDKFSWLQQFAPREDGLEVRCCPYDSNYQAKPMRQALAEAFSNAA